MKVPDIQLINKKFSVFFTVQEKKKNPFVEDEGHLLVNTPILRLEWVIATFTYELLLKAGTWPCLPAGVIK